MSKTNKTDKRKNEKSFSYMLKGFSLSCLVKTCTFDTCLFNMGKKRTINNFLFFFGLSQDIFYPRVLLIMHRSSTVSFRGSKVNLEVSKNPFMLLQCSWSVTHHWAAWIACQSDKELHLGWKITLTVSAEGNLYLWIGAQFHFSLKFEDEDCHKRERKILNRELFF